MGRGKTVRWDINYELLEKHKMKKEELIKEIVEYCEEHGIDASFNNRFENYYVSFKIEENKLK